MVGTRTKDSEERSALFRPSGVVGTTNKRKDRMTAASTPILAGSGFAAFNAHATQDMWGKTSANIRVDAAVIHDLS